MPVPERVPELSVAAFAAVMSELPPSVPAVSCNRLAKLVAPRLKLAVAPLMVRVPAAASPRVLPALKSMVPLARFNVPGPETLEPLPKLRLPCRARVAPLAMV